MKGIQYRKGIREQIVLAPTIAAVDKALKVGATFEYASDKTRRRWQTTAQKRKAELTR